MRAETIDKLQHLPGKSRDIVIGFTDRIAEAFAERLDSMILFGSAAGVDFIEGKSDINTLIVLDSVRTADLNIVMDLGKGYFRKALAIPLIFEKGHVSTSLDTFPIEFSDMKNRHILLYGNDPLANAVIEGRNLRYQCERELKSMLVNLRRGFLRTGGKKDNLESLLENSLSTALAACRGLIWMAGKTPPDRIDDLLVEIRAIYGCETSAIERVWHLRKGHSGATAVLEQVLDAYAAEIAKLASKVDRS